MQKCLILVKSLGDKELERKVFLDYLLKRKTSSVLHLKLNLDPYFGMFSHLDYKEIDSILKKCEESKLVDIGAKIKLSSYGRECFDSGKIIKRKKELVKKNKVSNYEEEKITKYSEFLSGLNQDQKKAVVCLDSSILCVAGAGSGKTTVLVKRIVHLVKNLGVNPNLVLAITFTRKARDNMEEKLDSFGVSGVRIYTFNSFGESLVRSFGFRGRLVDFSLKKKIVFKALEELGLNVSEVLLKYFGESDGDVFKFINDCFCVRDYFNNMGIFMDEFYKKFSDVELGEIVYRIVLFINAYFKKYGVYDYSDQLVMGLDRIRPRRFEHVLVDEYQDINPIQEKMILKLESPNLFCVGDPRQSIYGWRGSKVDFILNFAGTVIYLVKNYRSCSSIVSLGNSVISSMDLPDLESVKYGGVVELNRYDTLKDEIISVVKKIQKSATALKDIFVIARTNNILLQIEEELDRAGISYTIKNDSVDEEGKNDSVSLLTTHCAKGLEAQEVYVVGCTSRLYPCIQSDHKLLEFVKEYYNKREEERRLLYVALTRACSNLYISYFGKSISRFLKGKVKVSEGEVGVEKLEVVEKLKKVRVKISNQLKVPEYLVMSDSEIRRLSREEEITFKVLKKVLYGRANKYGDLIMERI